MKAYVAVTDKEWKETVADDRVVREGTREGYQREKAKMTPCEICGCACERERVPNKPSTIVACESNGFSFHITLEGKHELQNVRETEDTEVVRRAIGRMVRYGKVEHEAGGCLRIDSRFVRIMADRPVDG